MNMNDAFVGSLIFNKDNSGGASSLENLTDVNITTPQEGDTLVYDSVNSKWINGSAQPFIQGDLTVEASLGWQLRQKYFVKNGICFIDIILGTDQNGFSEDEKICSGAPIPQGMVTASLIGLCDGSFYRFYVDDEGDVYCRYPISAQYKEVIVFGSYPTNQ